MPDVQRSRAFSAQLLSVGGFTLLSRIAGFIRDIVLAAVLGAGPIADAFFVALRLPNHFRAIFAEGAFNAAFVPAYAREREQNGAAAASLFGDRVLAILLASQLLLLGLALAFTPAVVRLLAPGFDGEPTRFPLAVELTRITFPYLLLMTLVTLLSGILNAVQRFAAAAAAPILLNICLIAALALAAFFPTAGHAAAWAVLLAGCLEVLLVSGAAWRAGVLVWPRWPRWGPDLARFFRALGPATVGSAGVQLALLADTVIASFLSVGALSALYYADRLNQLPIGVIGIAAGTVLLPEMARRIAAGDEAGASHAQNRAMELTLLLSIPFVAGFLVAPELIMRALFSRGAFSLADADAAGATLRAYAIGLLPFVLIRSMVAVFFARGDTATPVKAALAAAAANIGLKFVLAGSLSQVGLALATSAGGWINIALVAWLAHRAGLWRTDASLRSALPRLLMATLALMLILWASTQALARYLPQDLVWRDEIHLLLLIGCGALGYALLTAALFGRRWWTLLSRKGATPGARVDESDMEH
jgi:putative peptidoglycan lipid II flippase